MHIKTIKLSNFQCFAEKPTSFTLEKDTTCFIGNNGSGKSAVLKSLQRVFGKTVGEKTVLKSDFHLGSNESVDTLQNKKLFIDIVFEFEDNEEKEYFASFVNVVYESSEKKFCVRIRLEASWTNGSYEDDVDSQLFWVLTGDDIPNEENTTSKIRVAPHERRLINLIYIPAVRDIRTIIKNSIQAIMNKIEHYINIDDDAKEKINNNNEALRKNISELEAIKTIQKELSGIWSQAHDNTLPYCENILFEFIGSNFEDIIKTLSLKFTPGEVTNTKDVSELSDGQISLLYLTLSIALYDLEIKHKKNELNGIKEQDYPIPLFTILALEEPENHLSPFYLSRILSLIEEKSNHTNFINIITSHSPNIVRRMKRIEQIRFLRQDINTQERQSVMHTILLPEDKNAEDYKYINGAVLAHPELYFSKLVILGEGDSEKIILPAIAQKMEYDFDTSFISFIPLAGAHVNHMWQLLEDLHIPYITLLDFDLGRKNGGMKKIDYISKEIDKHNIDNKEFLKNINTADIKDCIKKLEEINIYFSYPLDLDMMMMEAFPDLYISNAKQAEHSALVTAVLGEQGCEDAYTTQKIEFFSDEDLKKYRYLFINKSKVASHYQSSYAMQEIKQENFLQKCPEVLTMLIKKALKML